MPGQARLGDPTDHGGMIITSSSDTYTDGIGVARIGDTVSCPIHGNNPIVSGATSHFTNGVSNARIGDTTACGSTIVAGSTTRYVDDASLPDPGEAMEAFQPSVTPRQAAIAMIEEPGPITAKLQKLQDQAGLPTVDVPIPPADTTPPATPSAAPVSKDCSAIQGMTEFPASFQLTTNFNLGSVSTNTLLQRSEVVAQMGLTKQQLICNLKDAAQNLLEPISAHFGRPMITSGFRPSAQGKATSNHVYGCAFDLQWAGLSDAQYYDYAVWIRDNLQWSELILEFGGNRPWIHVAYKADTATRSKVMTRVGAKPDKYATGLIKCTNLPGIGGKQ